MTVVELAIVVPIVAVAVALIWLAVRRLRANFRAKARQPVLALQAEMRASPDCTSIRLRARSEMLQVHRALGERDVISQSHQAASDQCYLYYLSTDKPVLEEVLSELDITIDWKA